MKLLARPLAPRKIVAVAFLATALALGHGARAEPQSLSPDPGLTNPKLRFHTGKIAKGAPEISPVAPDMPGRPSPWYVVQWSKDELLRPEGMRRGDSQYADPRLGVPAYTWDTASHESRLSIFTQTGGAPVFELAATGGSLSSAGGSNLLLAVDVARPDATFASSIDLSFDVKLSQAEIAAPPEATRSGAVLAQMISGFTLEFTDPDTRAKLSVFMQIVLGNSRNHFKDYRGCHQHNGQQEIVFNSSEADEVRLPFVASDQAPVHARYNLNRHLCQMLSARFSCHQKDGEPPVPFAFTPAQQDPQNWRLTSMYVGLETEDRDMRPEATTHDQQGRVAVALQLSNLRLTGDASPPALSCAN